MGIATVIKAVKHPEIQEILVFFHIYWWFFLR